MSLPRLRKAALHHHHQRRCCWSLSRPSMTMQKTGPRRGEAPNRAAQTTPKIGLGDVLDGANIGGAAFDFGTPLQRMDQRGRLQPLEGAKLEQKLAMLEKEQRTENRRVMHHQWCRLLRMASLVPSPEPVSTVFHRMRRSFGESLHACNIVLAAHARNGRIDEATHLFETIPAKTSKPHSFTSYFLLMDALVPSHKLPPDEITARTRKLWRVYNRMRLDGIVPSSHCLVELLHLFYLQKTSKARMTSLLRCVHRLGTPVSSSAITSVLARLRPDLDLENIAEPSVLLSEYARQRRPQQTLQQFRKIQHPDSITLARTVHCLARCQQWNHVFELISETTSANLSVNAFSTLLQFAAKQNRWDCVNKVIAEADRRGLVLRDMAYTTAINEAAKRHRWELVPMFFQQLQVRDNVALAALARMAAMKGDFNQCFDIVSGADTPDLVLCTIALSSARTAAQIRQAWHNLLSRGLVVDDAALTVLRRACLLYGDDHLLSRMVDEAAHVMVEAGQAWPSLLNLMMTIALTKGPPEESWLTLGLFVRAGEPPSSPIISTLFRMLGFEKTLEWMTESNLSLGIWECNLLLRMLALHDEGDRVDDVFKRMMEKGIRPNAHSYNSLVISYAKQLDVRRIKLALAHMQLAGFGPNSTTMSALVFMSVRLNDVHTCVHMLTMVKHHQMAISFTAASAVAQSFGFDLLRDVRVLQPRSGARPELF